MRINEVVSTILSAYMDWNHILVNPKPVWRGNTITWIGYKPSKLEEPVTLGDLRLLASEHQYTLQVWDGSLIQIYYRYADDGAVIKSASLGYYGLPGSDTTSIKETDRGGSEGFEGDLWASHDDDALVRWLRVDYDHVGGGVLHSDCHMHVAGLPTARFVVGRVPTPKQFIEFVIASCYPEAYKQHRLEADGSYRDAARIRGVNVPTVGSLPNPICEHITHVAVPRGGSM